MLKCPITGMSKEITID